MIAMAADLGDDTETQVVLGAIEAREVRRRPYRPDQIRVDRGDYRKASGRQLCGICGCDYNAHPDVRGYSWLTRLCNGSLVKL